METVAAKIPLAATEIELTNCKPWQTASNNPEAIEQALDKVAFPITEQLDPVAQVDR